MFIPQNRPSRFPENQRCGAGRHRLRSPQIVPTGVLAAEGSLARTTGSCSAISAWVAWAAASQLHGRPHVSGDVRVAAVCDVDEKRLASALERAGEQAKPYRDYRYVLERKDVDAVVIATPDHWHACKWCMR